MQYEGINTLSEVKIFKTLIRDTDEFYLDRIFVLYGDTRNRFDIKIAQKHIMAP
jgi:hypothetical protein